MTKKELQKRIQGLNKYMLSDTDKQLILLNISNVYTYNKAIALIDKDIKDKDWYSIDSKNCFKTWNEAEIFLAGLCLGKTQNLIIMNMKGKMEVYKN